MEPQPCSIGLHSPRTSKMLLNHAWTAAIWNTEYTVSPANIRYLCVSNTTSLLIFACTRLYDTWWNWQDSILELIGLNGWVAKEVAIQEYS
jgi:hypothetical protein